MEDEPILVVPSHLHLESCSQFLLLSQVDRKYCESSLETMLSLSKMTMSCKIFSQIDIIDDPILYLVRI